MKFAQKNPPREFDGAGNPIKDHGDVFLDSRDQVTFITPSGRKTDFTAMPWGFYVTNSLNGRCRAEGFKTALVRNPNGRKYLNLVEEDRVDEFLSYLREQGSKVEAWLDED